MLIDGRAVPFTAGHTVMETARRHGIYIPSLCYHPKIGPLATCRICVVEVDGMEGLQVSCRLPAEEGMVVRTESATVLEARRTLLNLLLAGGRHDCDDCGADGDCELQEVARRLNIEGPAFIVERDFPPRDDSSPMIARRPELCIACGRCVAGCSGTVVNDILAVGGRGEETRIICDEDLPMAGSGCVQCGECVQLCPTGALLDRKTNVRTRPLETDRVDTICPYCGVGCGLTLHVRLRSGRVFRVTGTEGHPVSDGMLCVKGRYGCDFIHSDERLTRPLVRFGSGSFRETSWDEAITIVSGSLRRIIDQNSSEAVAGLSSAKCTNEENYLFQKFFRLILRTNNVDHCARLCHSSTVTGMAETLGSGAMTNDIAGIGKADVILVIGSDTTAAHPVIASRIKQSVLTGRTRLIVIDPKRIDLAGSAAIYARQRCGTDVAVINGIMHLILKMGLEDRAFIEERCEGLGKLEATVARYTPERVEQISGVSAGTLEKIAALFGGAGTASVFYAMGITQHTSGTDNVRSLVNLQLLCGNLGKDGGGVNPLRGQCNVQGSCDMGALPDVLPGYRRVDDEIARAEFEKAWGGPLPPGPGLTAMETVDAAGRGRVKALYIMGENPCLSDPDIDHVRKSLSRLDFLVVQDIFLTETARLADVVLPAACFAEKDGLFTNTERRVQRIRRAVEPPGDAREDWRIIQQIARSLGAPWDFTSAEQIQDEIRRLTPPYGGITWERVEREGLQWPCPSLDHRGTSVLHRSSFPVGRARMKAVSWRPPDEEPDDSYPFILTTGRLLPQFHTGTMTRRAGGMDELAGPMVMISEEDAATLGVLEGETVLVTTRRGSLRAPARITDCLGAGTLFIPFHFREAAANLLTNPALDPEAKIPELKVCAASLERASPNSPEGSALES